MRSMLNGIDTPKGPTMSKTAYTHMTATGEVKTRKSARTYTHVVVINDNGVHRVTNYAGSEALARKTQRRPRLTNRSETETDQ